MKPFPLFFLLSTFITIFQTTIANDLIDSTCTTLSRISPNVDHTFCTTSLQAAHVLDSDGLEELGRITIKLIHDNLTNTEHYIKEILNNGTWDPYTAESVGHCLGEYADAIASAEDATANYIARRFNDANVEISAVTADLETCQEGFEEVGADSPLTKRNADAYELSAMALGIMSLIQPVQNE